MFPLRLVPASSHSCCPLRAIPFPLRYHLPAAWHALQSSGAVLAPSRGWAAHEAAFARGEVLVIDDLLTPSALAELRTLGLDATIWMQAKEGSYVGSQFDDGCANLTCVRVIIRMLISDPPAQPAMGAASQGVGGVRESTCTCRFAMPQIAKLARELELAMPSVFRGCSHALCASAFPFSAEQRAFCEHAWLRAFMRACMHAFLQTHVRAACTLA